MGGELRRVGDFEIVREIGRGGMGVVYEAVQVSLDRRVALKVLPPGATPEQRHVERFRREAQAAASLDHPNIVPIYAQGEEEGTYYYAMRLVPGRSLSEVIRDTRQQWEAARASGEGTTLSQRYFRTAATLIMEVAEALEYAHSRGVIHRDIKPHNLILTPEGHLVVTDFGLARFMGTLGLTVSGEMMGTPAYMSPEQVRARQHRIDNRTDTYSLGVTLYEMLALSVPFWGETREAVLRQILMKDPAPLRRLNPRIPKDLETICHRAMEKEPDRRYPSAKLLAHDLRCFLEGLPIGARPVGTLGRLYRRARRHKALTAAIGLAVAALFAGAYFGVQAYHARTQAVRDALRAEEQERLAVKLQARAEEEAHRAEEETAARAAEEEARRSAQIVAEQERQRAEAARRAREAEQAAKLAAVSLAEQERERAESEQQRANAEVAAMLEERRWRLLNEASPLIKMGRYSLALGKLKEAGVIRSDHITKLALYCLADSYSDDVVAEFVSSAPGAAPAAFCIQDRGVAVGSSDGTVTVWDVGTRQTVRTLDGHKGGVTCVVGNPVGTLIATGGADSAVVVWTLVDGAPFRRLDDLEGRVRSLAWSPDGRYLAGADDSSTSFWEVRTGAKVGSCRPVQYVQPQAVAFSPDGTTAATGASDCAVTLWQVPNGALLRTLTGHKREADRGKAGIHSVCFDHAGTVLASGGGDETVRLWDVRSRCHLKTLWGHRAAVLCVDFGPRGRTLSSATADGEIAFWDVEKGSQMRSFAGHRGEVVSIDFSSDGSALLSGGTDGVARVWDAPTGSERRSLTGHAERVNTIAFSADGSLLASGSADGTTKVWDTATGRELGSLELGPSYSTQPVHSLAFARQGALLAVGGASKTVAIWDPVARTVTQDVVRYGRGAGPVLSLAWRTERPVLAYACRNHVPELWDLENSKSVRRAASHTPSWAFRATCASFDAKGAVLAVGGEYGEVTLNEVDSGTEVRTLRAHDGPVTALAFSPDSEVLASGGNDLMIRLWNVADGTERAPLAGHTNAVTALGFSRDGAILVSGSWRGIMFWDVRTGRAISTIGRLADEVSAIGLGPEGRRLACVVGSTVLLYDLQAYDKVIHRWLKDADAGRGQEAP